MSNKSFYLLFLITLSLLFGCTNIKNDKHNQSNFTNLNLSSFTYDQIKPFLDAGCQPTSDSLTLDCANASFDFKCAGPVVLEPLGLALNPKLAIAQCFTFGDNLTEAEMKNYFYCSGGLRYGCTSYIYWNGTNFIQIKNSYGLAKLVGPIENEKEALNYVFLSKNVLYSIDREGAEPLISKAEKTDEGFLVTVYHYSPFGCYSSKDYYEIVYQVSSSGVIEEKNNKVVYSKPLGYTICVD